MMNANQAEEQKPVASARRLRRCFFVRTKSHEKGRRENLFDESVAVAHE
jgi:hypothetical protein